MESKKDRADQHRAEAERIRLLAAETFNEQVKQHLLDLAKEFEALAEGVEQGRF